MTEHVVTFRLEGGGKPSRVFARTVGEDGVAREPEIDEELRVSRPTTVVAWALDPGYWTVARKVTADVAIEFPRIASPGRHGWWHGLHGVAASRSTGRGIRIGVIDEALERQGESSCIRHVNNLAGSAWSSGSPARAVTPIVVHSLAVCSLLASRPRDALGVAGVAPGADVYFAAAGEDDSPQLDPTRLANSIDLLAEEHGCHLITVSAGDSRQPTDEILFSVRAARERGCLCLFAAGNQGGEPLYPARYAESLAVGACGRHGVAPEGTYLDAVARNADAGGDDRLFLWRNSARGQQVELLAAGVGTLWCINGRVAFATCGTSYAAPVAAGVLAVILSTDEEYTACPPGPRRSALALGALAANSRSLGFDGLASYGVPIARE